MFIVYFTIVYIAILLINNTTTGTTTTSQTVNDLITSLLQKIQSGAFTIQQDGRMYTVVDTAGATTTATAQKTSGNITINRGQTTATITFKTPFASTPEIIVTPSNSHAGTVVTIVSKSATGFTISVPSKDYTAKRTFTYLAFISDQDNGESAPDDIPADIADIYRDINKLDQQVVDEANMVNIYTNPHAILRYGNTYMVYNKLGQVIMVKSYSNPSCSGGTETTPPTCTTPTLLSTQSRTYTGDGRTKNIDSSTYTVNTDYDETGNKVYEEVIDKATNTKKTTTYWSDTERTYHTCTGTTCTLDREEKDILVDGRRHATMIVKNGVETYRYYLTNTLGTTSLALGEDGAILEESDTNPYGDIRYGSNNNEVTTYYGLHERNDTTGLIDMEARMYDPSNLQFSAPDPISLYNPTAYLSDPSQMHMYAYAKGNPVRYNDPTGLKSKVVQNTLNSAKSLATKAVSAVTSSSAFKSVTARFGGGGSSATQTIAPGVMQGPMQLIGPVRPPVVINFERDSDRKMVSQSSMRVIEGLLIESKNPSGTITSVGRTPEKQVQIMINNVNTYGMNSQKKMYGKYGDMVLDQYPNYDKMLSKMYEVGPTNVSKHIADQNVLNVIDLGPSSIQNQNSFESAALNSPYVSTFLYPNHPTNPDPAFHLVIPQ